MSSGHEQPKRGERLIFIGGAPRSGTTLVQNILDSHPDIYGGPEFDFIPVIVNKRRQIIQSIARGRIDAFCSQEDVDEAIADLIERLLLPAADRHAARYISEKTPVNVVVFVDLAHIFRAARFIHVIRDPRATVSSMLQVGRRGRKQGKQTPPFTTDIHRAIDLVKKCDRAGIQAAKFAPARVIPVVYEDLVTRPEGKVEEICCDLGIEPHDEMVCPGGQSHPGDEHVDGIWYNKQEIGRNIETKEINKWKQLLTREEKATINEVFRNDELYQLIGYDFSG